MGTEEPLQGLCSTKAVPLWMLGEANGVKEQKLGGQVLRCICYSLQREDPAELVVDVGCGSGQGTRFLAEHFKKVVGTDISEAQIQEARDAPSQPNVSYL